MILWKFEKQRGISVSTSVMAFDYKNYKVSIIFPATKILLKIRTAHSALWTV